MGVSAHPRTSPRDLMVSPRICCAICPTTCNNGCTKAILDILRGNKIPHTWLASRVVLIYKKKDPQDPKNNPPIYVSTAICGILT